MASRSLSPLSKDPNSVGKLINKQERSQLINQQSQTHDFSIRDINNPEQLQTKNNGFNIGVNTSRLKQIAYKQEDEIKPVTQHNKGQQFKMESGVCKIDLMNQTKRSNKKLNVSTEKLDKWSRQSGFFRINKNNGKQKRSPIGTIFSQKSSVHSTRSAPKQSLSNTAPQLPSINKIQTNLKGFRSFMGENQVSPFNNTSVSALNTSTSKKQIGKTYVSTVFNRKNDPEEDQKLHHPRRGLRNSRAVKLPNFVQQTHKQYEIQTSFEPRQLSPTNGNQSRTIQKNINAFQSQNSQQQIITSSYHTPEDLTRSRDFIYSPSTSPYSFKIDLRTPISRIKQLLIESSQILHTSFMIPQIFFHPPSQNTTPKQLHHMMLQIFKFIDINPQIVTIKKYINCVMMCDKRLCILWSYSGKIYFGGWDRNEHSPNSHNQSRMLTQGNKHGIGLQWIPSRYIYYGEFKDNKKQGFGMMKKSNKELYVGEWKSNQRQGWGKVYNMLGELVQDGEFIEGCFIREREKNRPYY